MPFITEELWHELQERNNRDCIIVSSWPKTKSFHNAILTEATLAFDIITEVRNSRASKGLSPKEALKLLIKNGETVAIKSFWPVVKKLSNLSEVSFVKESPTMSCAAFLVKSTEFFIPMEGKIDAEKEREALLRDLEYQKGFIISLDKKLLNEKFVANAKPEVVAIERKKKADAEAKIKAIEEALARL